MTDRNDSSAESCDLKPCPFCGSKIKHIESWAKSFKPPRLYHEWHHVDDNPDCQIFRFSGKIVVSATDDEEMRRAATARWNARTATDAQPAAKPIAWMNREHIGAYMAGTPRGLAWASPEQTEFYDIALYAAQPPAAPVETVTPDKRARCLEIQKRFHPDQEPTCEWPGCGCDETEAPQRSSAESALAVGNPIAWMNREHVDAYAAGHPDGIAWASHEQSEFYTVPVYLTAPQSSVMQAAEKAVKTVEGWSDAKRDYAARVMGDAPNSALLKSLRHTLDVMKKARDSSSQIMSIWAADVQAVEHAIAALSLSRPQLGSSPASPDVSTPARQPRE